MQRFQLNRQSFIEKNICAIVKINLLFNRRNQTNAPSTIKSGARGGVARTKMECKHQFDVLLSIASTYYLTSRLNLYLTLTLEASSIKLLQSMKKIEIFLFVRWLFKYLRALSD